MRKARKVTTREEYNNKFNEYMNNKQNYIMQANEQWKQLEECDYMFLSNMGYIVSVYWKNPRILKPFTTGKKSAKQYFAWKVKGHNEKMHKLISDYWNLDINTEYFDELLEKEVHHMLREKPEWEDSPQRFNNINCLQKLAADWHKELTKIERISLDKFMQQPDSKKELQISLVNLYKFIDKGICSQQPHINVVTYDKVTGEVISSEAITTTKENVLDLLTRRNRSDER